MKTLLAGVMAGTLFGGCAQDASCQVACSDTIGIIANSPNSPPIGATVTLCQNATCASGPIIADGTVVTANLTGGFGAVVTVSGGNLSTFTSGATAFADGDVWALKVTSSAGIDLFHGSVTVVQYDEITACVDTCKQADITIGLTSTN
jgi:hypothetical protein